MGKRYLRNSNRVNTLHPSEARIELKIWDRYESGIKNHTGFLWLYAVDDPAYWEVSASPQVYSGLCDGRQDAEDPGVVALGQVQKRQESLSGRGQYRTGNSGVSVAAFQGLESSFREELWIRFKIPAWSRFTSLKYPGIYATVSFFEKFTPVGMSMMAGLNSRNRITMLKSGLWEYIVVQLAAGEHPPITDRLPFLMNIISHSNLLLFMSSAQLRSGTLCKRFSRIELCLRVCLAQK